MLPVEFKKITKANCCHVECCRAILNLRVKAIYQERSFSGQCFGCCLDKMDNIWGKTGTNSVKQM